MHCGIRDLVNKSEKLAGLAGWAIRLAKTSTKHAMWYAFRQVDSRVKIWNRHGRHVGLSMWQVKVCSMASIKRCAEASKFSANWIASVLLNWVTPIPVSVGKSLEFPSLERRSRRPIAPFHTPASSNFNKWLGSEYSLMVTVRRRSWESAAININNHSGSASEVPSSKFHPELHVYSWPSKPWLWLPFAYFLTLVFRFPSLICLHQPLDQFSSLVLMCSTPCSKARSGKLSNGNGVK